ncbi:hypothetical protein VTI74DRAFT_8073 [Chaetomium olivicolor]
MHVPGVEIHLTHSAHPRLWKRCVSGSAEFHIDVRFSLMHYPSLENTGRSCLEEPHAAVDDMVPPGFGVRLSDLPLTRFRQSCSHCGQQRQAERSRQFGGSLVGGSGSRKSDHTQSSRLASSQTHRFAIRDPLAEVENRKGLPESADSGVCVQCLHQKQAHGGSRAR